MKMAWFQSFRAKVCSSAASMSIVPTLWGERHDPEAKASIQDIQMVATLSTNVVDDDDDNDLKMLLQPRRRLGN